MRSITRLPTSRNIFWGIIGCMRTRFYSYTSAAINIIVWSFDYWFDRWIISSSIPFRIISPCFEFVFRIDLWRFHLYIKHTLLTLLIDYEIIITSKNCMIWFILINLIGEYFRMGHYNCCIWDSQFSYKLGFDKVALNTNKSTGSRLDKLKLNELYKYCKAGLIKNIKSYANACNIMY